MDNQDSHHHVCYIAYWISNICEISVREFAYSRLMFCLHREGSSVSRENKDVFWASDAERRDTRYVWLTRLARPQWTVGGCFRGFPAFHQRRTTAPPCLCVSHSHPLRPTSDGDIASTFSNPSAVTLIRSRSLFLSFCQWISELTLFVVLPPPARRKVVFQRPAPTNARVRHLREVESESNSLKSRRQISDQISNRYCDYQLFREYPY